MIKLITIISEIQNLGKITPEKVNDLIKIIINTPENEGKALSVWGMIDDYSIKNKLNPDYPISNLSRFPPDDLVELYKKFLEVKKSLKEFNATEDQDLAWDDSNGISTLDEYDVQAGGEDDEQYAYNDFWGMGLDEIKNICYENKKNIL